MKKPFAAKRINVWVDPAFYQQLKVQAALNGMTLKAFVIEALTEKLRKQ